jgi:5-formyltetrahydrofolate cyclo-ligase
VTDGHGGPAHPTIRRAVRLSHSEDLVRRKAELRALLLTRRRAAAGSDAAVAVADRLLDEIGVPQAAVVSGYWPLAGELDPRPCLRRLAARGQRLALPRMQGQDRPLAFHAWRWDDPLALGRFGVMEPDPAQPLVTPDVLLVPLLGFDRRGHRLGYGKGYYDRTLRALREGGAAPLAIGLAFALQEVGDVPVGPADQPLDAVVTERASHRWSPPSGSVTAPAGSA